MKKKTIVWKFIIFLIVLIFINFSQLLFSSSSESLFGAFFSKDLTETSLILFGILNMFIVFAIDYYVNKHFDKKYLKYCYQKVTKYLLIYFTISVIMQLITGLLFNYVFGSVIMISSILLNYAIGVTLGLLLLRFSKSLLKKINNFKVLLLSLLSTILGASLTTLITVGPICLAVMMKMGSV